MTDKTNFLAAETSPYLRMHAHNPVEWYPWNEQALEKARQENKPILLSIGYTACHWCHVMAKESFEDQATADLMNKHFVNIKVDREERPDLDKIYQIAYQIFSRRAGGWPLTVFLTPDKHIPFFVGTYFPDESRGNLPAFKDVLEYVAYFYKHHQNEINQQNASFKNVIQLIEQQNQENSDLAEDLSTELTERLLSQYDRENGGFGSAPKFPMPSYLQFLMIYEQYYTKHVSGIKDVLQHSLDAMAKGGLYDHLGGGFFRYCVDANWTIPHFEKMLYDNAQLLGLYTEAYLQYQKPVYKQIAQATANWILTIMQSEQGGYFSTMSADSEGEEGKYYAWTKQEIKSLLTAEEYKIIEQLFGLYLPANFENHWHLKIHHNFEELTNNKATTAINKLLQQRQIRVQPEIDDKILTSWNGLTIKAMLMAGYYLNNESFIASAEKALSFIKNNMWKNETLYACCAKDKTDILAYLDDYAFLLYAILQALQINWNSELFSFAQSLIKNMLADFFDDANGGFYFTSKQSENLLLRIKQQQDDAIPSGSAIATFCLINFGFLLGENNYLEKAELSLRNAYKQMLQIPEAHCHFFISLMLFFKKPEILIIRGKKNQLNQWEEISKKYYHPFRMVYLIPDQEHNLPESLQYKFSSGENVIAYYCQGYECKSPISSLQEFENVLRTRPIISAKN